MGLVQKSFSDIITFSRSSNATRVGPTGVLEYAPHNLLTYSEQFDNAAWTKSNTTVTANAAAAPNGTVTADLVTANTSSSFGFVFSNQTASGVFTTSVYAKQGTQRYIQFLSTGTVAYWANFDLQDGLAYAGGTTSSVSIVSVGNGWYRCSMSVTDSSSNQHTIGFVTSLDSARAPSTTLTTNCYLWGAQLSVGPYALDYTPTTSAAVYGPRFDYDPVTLAARGLLVEEQRTNLCLYSEQFDNAAWNSAPVSVNSTVAPDGTTTAESFTSSNYFYQQISYASNNTVTFSMFAKGAGTLRSQLSDNSTGEIRCDFNLTAGTAATPVATGSWTSPSASITALSNGWYRCSITATKGAGSSILIQPTPVAGQALWGAQLETGSFASSYIPTVASTVTRSADVASVNTLSPWFNASAGTLYAESVSYNNLPYAFSITNTGSADIIGLGSSGANFSRLYIETGGVTQANVSVAYTGSTAKEAAAYAANDAIDCVNGTLSSQDTSVSLPTLNKVDIGYFPPAGTRHNGWIRRLAYFPRRLSSAELQALTA